MVTGQEFETPSISFPGRMSLTIGLPCPRAKAGPNAPTPNTVKVCGRASHSLQHEAFPYASVFHFYSMGSLPQICT